MTYSFLIMYFLVRYCFWTQNIYWSYSIIMYEDLANFWFSDTDLNVQTVNSCRISFLGIPAVGRLEERLGRRRNVFEAKEMQRQINGIKFRIDSVEISKGKLESVQKTTLWRFDEIADKIDMLQARIEKIELGKNMLMREINHGYIIPSVLVHLKWTF